VTRTAPGAEERISELAALQHGLVTRTQLVAAGLSSDAVQNRVRAKRLRPVHRGVYQVGPLVSPHAREMAAVLACGPGTVVCHRSAAGLWRLLPARGDSALVEVLVSPRIRRRRPAVRAYRGHGLEADEATTVAGIPITTPSRTVLDLAGAVGSRDLERALARAEREGLTSRGELLSLLDRHSGRPGLAVLRPLLADGAGPAFTRSEPEERLLGLIRKAQLPPPEVNGSVAGYEVDFLWRAERLVVEVDGFAFHSSRDRFESDRRRDGRLAARGYRVMRVTWRQITREPEALLARLAQALALAGVRGT